MQRMKPEDKPVRLGFLLNEGMCEKCGLNLKYGDKKWCLVCIEKWKNGQS